jgi:RNA-binding protein
MLKGKHKRYLRGLAVTMDPILHIGKGGVDAQVERQASDALRARELIKCRVLETAPETAGEVGQALAAALGAELVQVIGRNFLLYKRNPEEPRIQLP